MNSPEPRVAVRRVLDAYRKFNREAARAAGDNGTWLQVGSLLEHACLVDGEERDRYLDVAARSVRTAIGERAWRTGHYSDPATLRGEWSLEGRLRVLCEDVEDAGGLEFADAVLDAYLTADSNVSDLERARIEAVRARLAWKMGDLDRAEERYRRVLRAARRLGSDELRARTWIGRSGVARQRGNLPNARRFGRRAVRIAEAAQLGRLVSLAHQVAMVAFAIGGNFEIALEDGWRAYETASGHAELESASLGNIGQVFLDSGQPSTALAAFQAIMLRRPSDRIALPALGGLAVAAGRLELNKLVLETGAEINRRARGNAAPLDVAIAMLDLAVAFGSIGDVKRARESLGRARELAVAHGYHQLVHRTEDESSFFTDPVPAARSLSVVEEQVARNVRRLVPA